LTNTSFKDLVEETEDRLGKDQSYLLDSSKARNDLEWRDSIALEEGLIETLAWVDTNINTLKNFPLKYKHKA
jgi:dTDP-glucose 4,6-dehydratase